MVLLSNGGTNWHRSKQRSDVMVIGTVDGIALLERAGGSWTVKHRALVGCSVSAVTALDDGTLFAATHGVGVAAARSAVSPGPGRTTVSIASTCGLRAPAD